MLGLTSILCYLVFRVGSLDKPIRLTVIKLIADKGKIRLGQKVTETPEGILLLFFWILDVTFTLLPLHQFQDMFSVCSTPSICQDEVNKLVLQEIILQHLIWSTVEDLIQRLAINGIICTILAFEQHWYVLDLCNT